MRKGAGVILLVVLFWVFGISAVRAEGQKWTFVIMSQDKETAWNAVRVANFALQKGEKVSIFFLGKGVKAAQIQDEVFNVKELLEEFVEQGGRVYACKMCLKLHQLKPSKACPIGTLKILYDLLKDTDRILVF